MEKILLVVNANNPDNASIDFACRIAAINNSNLTGLFIENVYQPNPVSLYPEYYSMQQEEAGAAVKIDTDLAIKLFVDSCTQHNVSCETYVDKGEPIQETIFESRFTDLLVVDPKMKFYEVEEPLPTHFVKEILAGAECPVLLAPDQYTETDEVVFCYDGSASAMFAIKQFTYLLPQFRTKKIILLEVNKTGSEEFGVDHRRLMQWLQSHYETVTYLVLKGQAKDELFTYFFMQPKRFAVMGSYGRSQFSNFFKHSTADVLIRTVDIPVFIAHKQ